LRRHRKQQLQLSAEIVQAMPPYASSALSARAAKRCNWNERGPVTPSPHSNRRHMCTAATNNAF
jgi:transcription elongation factor